MTTCRDIQDETAVKKYPFLHEIWNITTSPIKSQRYSVTDGIHSLPTHLYIRPSVLSFHFQTCLPNSLSSDFHIEFLSVSYISRPYYILSYLPTWLLLKCYSVIVLSRYSNSSKVLRGIIRSAYLEKAYRRTAKKHENITSKWEEWEFTVQLGVMGSYCSNGSNGKLLSRWEE